MIDPVELETRFAIEDGMAFMDSVFDEPSEEALEQIEAIRDILEALPPREADFVDLYYFRKLKQTEIAAIFQVSQPTVCYRLQRAADRIKFRLKLPHAERSVLRADMEGFLEDPLDARIMLLMWETTCQSEVAKRLGVSQGLVRHRFIRTLTKMTEVTRFKTYVEMFKHIAANLNILREVQRPSWDQRITHIIH